MSVDAAKETKYDDTASNFQLFFDKDIANTEESFVQTYF
jgi:hypothetical protein